MPGTFVFRPIEATLNGEAALGSYSRSLDPFCKIQIGDQKFHTHPSKSFGTHPVWDESLVVQEGEKNTCTVSLRDTNKMNPNRRIGKFELNLDDVYNKGKVTKWFDIRKKDRVQGQLLMEVTYTQGNPQSKSFHQSILPGAAIASAKKPFNYYDHKNVGSRLTKSAQKQVQKELENVHSHGHGMTPPQKVNRLKDPTLNQLHLNKNNPADTGISNPNTMKLGINHPDAENDPSSWNTRNKEITPVKSHTMNPTLHLQKPHGVTAQKDLQKNLGTAPPSRVNKLKDPTLNQLHLEKNNFADTGMSNPNTMKLGVNHPENDPTFNIKDRELARYPNENPNYYDENDIYRDDNDIYNQGYSADTGINNPNTMNPTLHLKNPHGVTTQKDKRDLQKHLGTTPPSRVNKLRDPTLNQLHLEKNNWADTGMSNPNTMKLGVNHPENDPTFNIKDRELARYPNENPNYYDENDIYRDDKIYYDEYSADTGMSNPNMAGLSADKLRGLRKVAKDLALDERFSHLPGQHHGPFEIDKITTSYDTSLGAFSHPRDSHNSMISNPNTIREGINHRPGHVKAGIPEWVEPYYHPNIQHHHEPFEIDKITRVNDTSLGRASYQGRPQVIGMSNPNTMKMGVNERSTLPNYEQTKEMAKRLPNYHTKPTEVDKVTTVHDTTLGNPYHAKHLGDTEMSNPNTMKSGVNHYSNRNVDEFVDKHVGMQYTGPNEVDKITSVHDTTLGRYHHKDAESELADTGMSNPNTAKLGVNHEDRMQNVHLYAPEGYPNERTEPFEVDKITKVNDTRLERGIGGTGMSNPNMIKAGVNHRKESWNSNLSGGSGLQKPHYPHAFEIDKITTVHDTSLGRAGKSAASSSRKSSYNYHY